MKSKKLLLLYSLILSLIVPSVSYGTVATATNNGRIQHDCNGSDTDYVFTFNNADTTEVTVTVADSDGVETILVAGTNYTTSCTNNDCSSGGTVALASGTLCASGSQITITRNVDVTQETDFTSGMPALYETFETTLDKRTRIEQQLQEQLDRSLRIPVSDVTTLDMEMPGAADRASAYLAFDVNGEPIASTASVPSATVSTFAETILDDASTGEVLQTLLDDTTSDAIQRAWFLRSCDYVVDYTEGDQGAVGNGNTLKSYIDTIGSNNATICFPNTTRTGTTYTLTTSETVPTNVTLIPEPGAQIDGAGTLTLNGVVLAGPVQIFGSSITVDLSSNTAMTEAYSVWFSSLAATVTAVGGGDFTIKNKSDTLTANLTIPANVILEPLAGAVISGAFTLTINGPIIAGRRPILGTDVILAGNPKIEAWFPEYWAKNTTPGTTDMTTAIQKAVNVASNTGVVNVEFLPQRYKFTNLYLHYDAVNNPGFNSGEYYQGQIILKGSGRTARTALLNDAYRGTILESTSSTGTAAIYCDGNSVASNRGFNTRIEDMMIEVNNTTLAVAFDACPQNSGMSRVVIQQNGAGGGVVHADSWNSYYSNVRIEGAGKATSSDGFYLYNDDGASGNHILETIVANNFANGIILGHKDKATATYLNAIRAKGLQGGSCSVGITISGIAHFNVSGHAEQSDLGIKVINNARYGELFYTTASNTKDAEFGSSTADENYYRGIKVRRPYFTATGATQVEIWGGGNTGNLTFDQPLFSGDGTTTAFALDDSTAHENLVIIEPRYLSISTEIDNPHRVAKLIEYNKATFKAPAATGGALSDIPFHFEQQSTGGAVPVVRVYQRDGDVPFMQYEAVITPTTNYNIINTTPGDGSVVGPKAKNAANGWAFWGMMAIEIKTNSGTETKYIPLYDDDAL